MEERIAAIQDIPVLCEIRKQQLIDEGIAPAADIDEELARFFEEKIKDGSLVEWLMEDHGTVIATAAVLFMEFPPTYTNPSGIRGYITNMYTAPAYRGKGIAASLLGNLKEEAVRRGVTHLWLHASALGKPVYKRAGFTEAETCMEMHL